MVGAFHASLDSTQGVGVGGAWAVIPKSYQRRVPKAFYPLQNDEAKESH